MTALPAAPTCGRGPLDKLPVTADLRDVIGKSVGDTVTIHLTERL